VRFACAAVRRARCDTLRVIYVVWASLDVRLKIHISLIRSALAFWLPRGSLWGGVCFLLPGMVDCALTCSGGRCWLLPTPRPAAGETMNGGAQQAQDAAVSAGVSCVHIRRRVLQLARTAAAAFGSVTPSGTAPPGNAVLSFKSREHSIKPLRLSCASETS